MRVPAWSSWVFEDSAGISQGGSEICLSGSISRRFGRKRSWRLDPPPPLASALLPAARRDNTFHPLDSMKLTRLITLTLTLVAVAALAVLIAWRERLQPSRGMVGEPVMHLINLSQVGLVLIENHEGRVTIRWGKDGWSVDQQAGFTADVRKLRALMLNLLRTRVTEKVSEDFKALGKFALLRKVENNWKMEADKTGQVISIVYGLEKRHRLMFRLLIGKERLSSARSSGVGPVKTGGTYIRYPDTNRVYLISKQLKFSTKPSDWIDTRTFFGRDKRDMRRIRIRGRQGARLHLFREAPGTPWRWKGGTGKAWPKKKIEKIVGRLFGLKISRVLSKKKQIALMPEPGRVRFEVTSFNKIEYLLDFNRPASPPERDTLTIFARVPFEIPDGKVREKLEAFNTRFSGWVFLIDPKDAEGLFPH